MAVDLVERAHEEQKPFFGREVLVTKPPALLFEVQRIADGEGLEIFDPVYFPAEEFNPEAEYPGWRIRPDRWYWEQIKAGRLSTGAARLGGYWGLFDRSARPQGDNGQQFSVDDRFGLLMIALRKSGRIIVPNHLRHIHQASRLGVSPDEQDQQVFPALSALLRLIGKISSGLVRMERPTEMEFNFAGNLQYPYLGEVPTSEWLQDKFRKVGLLFGGNSDDGGLSDAHALWSNYHADTIAFRPLIKFNPET